MGRQLTGKMHTGQRRETRPNGDVYVYERVTAYDPKTKKTRTVSTKLLGKIPAGKTEMIPTRPKKMKSSDSNPAPEAGRIHAGPAKLLAWMGTASGIDADLRAAFDEGDAKKLISIARYWLATDGDPLPRMADWQRMNPLPYPGAITQDVYGELFRNVGQNERAVQSYFRSRAARVGQDELTLALDTTTFSTYSKNQVEARQGFNKDGDGLDTIKLMVLHSVKSREPIAFAKQPGNIPDRISLVNAAKQLQALSLPTPVIVADNGFYSQSNMAYLAGRGEKFLMLAGSTDKWVREEIDAVRDQITGFEHFCPFDHAVRGLTRRRTHLFTAARQRASAEANAGEVKEFSKRLYVHVFFRRDQVAEDEKLLYLKLESIRRDLESGALEFKPAAQKMIDRYLVVKRTPKKLQVTYNMQAITEAQAYCGFFVLVSNSVKDPFEALRDYRAREKVEEVFATYKESFDGRKPRTWYPENLQGRQFAQFVGLGYHCFFTKKILELKQTLGVDAEGKTQADIDLEKKLRTWLEQRSPVQILDWFRAVDFVRITGREDQVCRTTETTRRDELFLRLLGVE